MNWADREYAIGGGIAAIRHRHHRGLQYFGDEATAHALPELLAQAAGATFPNLSYGVLAAIAWPSLSVHEQHAIAHILGTLDDKIELNRRISETMEATARTIFKAWPVDFEPVRAKIEGRWRRGESLPGIPAHLYDLFPDRLVQSELGEIPEGWGVATIGDLAELVGGSTPSAKEPIYWEGGIHYWATPKDLSTLRAPVLLETKRKITDAGLAQINSGLLPRGTVLLSSRAPIGYLAIAEVPVAINQGLIAMKPRDGVSNLFLLCWATFAHDGILSRANGSTFQEISRASFRPIPVVLPSVAVIQAFDTLVRPLHQRIVANEREGRTLAALRDALLPNVVSGEIRGQDVQTLLHLATISTEKGGRHARRRQK